MEIKEVKVNDIVVCRGCEDCNCHNFGKIITIVSIYEASNIELFIYCRKKNFYTGKLVVMGPDGNLYPASWLSTYPHFENWHGH